VSQPERRLFTMVAGTERFVALRRSWRDDVRLSVVLVPGWREPRSGHLRLFTRLADTMRDEHLPVETWQFDLAGQGESVLPDDPRRWPDQVFAVATAGRGPAYLVGRGAGALLAAAHRSRAARVVAIDAPMPNTPPDHRLDALGCEEAVLADPAAGQRRAGRLWRSVSAATFDLSMSASDALERIPHDVTRFLREEQAC
jgi:hypothetical protein